jgi:uncharacterized membrane protein
MNDKKCTSCEASLDTDAIFCNECGTVQAAAVTAVPVSEPPRSTSSAAAGKSCPQCAKQLPESVRFCSGCAYDFTVTAATAETASPVCPNCQKLYDPNDRFCRHCAFDLNGLAKVSSAHFCTACGKTFGAADKFCRHCAADLSNSNHTIGVPLVSAAVSSSAAAANVPPPANSIPQFSATISPIAPVKTVSPPTFAAPVANSSEAENSGGGLQWLTPSTAAFALVCFFMPWVEVSCSAFGSRVVGKSASGADIARFDESLWLLPILAIVILVLFFAFKSQGKLSKARPLVGVAAGIGLLFMIFKALNFENSMRGMPSTSFGAEWRTGLDIEPRFGVFGMVLGFIGALVGIAFFGGKSAVREATAALPFEFKNPDGSVKPNVSAMLCYLMPVLIAILLYFLIGVIALGSLKVLVISLALQFAIPTILLKLKGNSRHIFIRFHAFQTIFLLAAYYVTSLVMAGIIMADEGGRLDPSAVTRLLLMLQIGLGLTMLGTLIFMAVQASKNTLYKLPYIGDQAMNFARKDAAQ